MKLKTTRTEDLVIKIEKQLRPVKKIPKLRTDLCHFFSRPWRSTNNRSHSTKSFTNDKIFLVVIIFDLIISVRLKRLKIIKKRNKKNK